MRIGKQDQLVKNGYYDLLKEVVTVLNGYPINDRMDDVIWEAADMEVCAGYSGAMSDGGAHMYLWRELLRVATNK